MKPSKLFHFLLAAALPMYMADDSLAVSGSAADPSNPTDTMQEVGTSDTGEAGAQQILSATGSDATAAVANSTSMTLTGSASVVGVTTTNGDVGEQSSPPLSGDDGSADAGNGGGVASTAADASASNTSSSAASASPVDGTSGTAGDPGADVHPHAEATGIVSRLRTAVQSAEAEVATALEAEFARLEQLIELLKHL
ncbi:hypothetical protein [Paraburkholderia sp.]|uniref:hypothetical protein n=1 Tax=Paraburkholderia sp. TaxID=1926495 RepID=UPI003D6F02A5